jgi:hypothetical protein
MRLEHESAENPPEQGIHGRSICLTVNRPRPTSEGKKDCTSAAHWSNDWSEYSLKYALSSIVFKALRCTTPDSIVLRKRTGKTRVFGPSKTIFSRRELLRTFSEHGKHKRGHILCEEVDRG